MYRFLIENSPAFPVSEQKLQELEHHLGYAFPAALRQHYLERNGQRSHESTFTSKGRTFTVSSIMPLFEYSMSAVLSKELLAHSSKLPGSFFPFAVSEEGDDYFVDLQDGQVYLVPTDSLDKHIPAADSVEAFFDLTANGAILPHTDSENDPVISTDPWSASQSVRIRKREKPSFFTLSRKKKAA